MANDQISRVSELLHEAAETHHTVYRITDGDDPNWASWYADWLLGPSELPDVLGTRPPRGQACAHAKSAVTSGLASRKSAA